MQSKVSPDFPYNYAFVSWDTMEAAVAAHAKLGRRIFIGASASRSSVD
jgi:hypothetical protein